MATTSRFLERLRLCAQCAGVAGGRYAHPRKPAAFHSVGIDVFKTVRKMGLPIDTLKDKDETPNWYSAVFIE